jgi:hypothetical protein
MTNRFAAVRYPVHHSLCFLCNFPSGLLDRNEKLWYTYVQIKPPRWNLPGVYPPWRGRRCCSFFGKAFTSEAHDYNKSIKIARIQMRKASGATPNVIVA